MQNDARQGFKNNASYMMCADAIKVCWFALWRRSFREWCFTAMQRCCQSGFEASKLNNRMSYLEELPPDCPPATADEIAASRDVFRLVRTSPPTLDDFRSQRAEKPQAIFRVSECQARGLSVFAVRQDSAKALKLPTLRDRLICRVRLEPGAGWIQETGKPSHHTWWPLAAFDILTHCNVESV